MFKLIVGVKPKIGQTSCFICEAEPKNFSEEDKINCKFCGNLFCPDCCYKKMRYPKGLDSGHICRICDRKFMMYKEFNEYKDIMTIQDKDLEQICMEFHYMQINGVKTEQKVSQELKEFNAADDQVKLVKEHGQK